MEQLRLNAKLFFTVLYISQVCGTPTFYLTQPDCYQQYGDDPYESYQSYQGPSYQETLQSMVQETIRAISEIVQITATATKQEFAAFSNIFFQNPPMEDCNQPDPGNIPGDYQFNRPPMYPGQPTSDFKPVEPQNESEEKIQNITFTTEKEMPHSTMPSPTPSKGTAIGNTTSTASPQVGDITYDKEPVETQNGNLTTEMTMSNASDAAPAIDIRGGVDQTTTSQPSHLDEPLNGTNPSDQSTTLSVTENITSTQPSPSENVDHSNTTSVEYSTSSEITLGINNSNVSTMSPLAGEPTTYSFITDQTITDNATEISTTELSTLQELTTLALNTTAAEVAKKANRKPKL